MPLDVGDLEVKVFSIFLFSVSKMPICTKIQGQRVNHAPWFIPRLFVEVTATVTPLRYLHTETHSELV